MCLPAFNCHDKTREENAEKEERLISSQGFRDFSPWYLALLFLGLWGGEHHGRVVCGRAELLALLWPGRQVRGEEEAGDKIHPPGTDYLRRPPGPSS